MALGKVFRAIALSTAAMLLPGVQWAFFSWLHLLLPLIAFHVTGTFGLNVGAKILGVAAAISLAGHIIGGNFDLFFFSLALAGVGYLLYRSGASGDSPATSGGKGSCLLAASWGMILFIFTFGGDVTGYSQLLQSLDYGISQTLEHYRQSAEVTAETLVMLEATLLRMQELVPLIMPAILGCLVLLVVWMTMVVGNRLLATSAKGPVWSSYSLWQLPDRLVWLFIILAVVALLPMQPFRNISINSLILLSLTYAFQGLAITVFFMNKWGVPVLLRSFIYVMIVFQSVGTVVLLLFGIADIWLDFRKIRRPKPDPRQHV